MKQQPLHLNIYIDKISSITSVINHHGSHYNKISNIRRNQIMLKRAVTGRRVQRPIDNPPLYMVLYQHILLCNMVYSTISSTPKFNSAIRYLALYNI